MITRRRASGERPSQAARGVFDSYSLIVQFYRRMSTAKPNTTMNPERRRGSSRPTGRAH
jgi:hypothetical protein